MSEIFAEQFTAGANAVLAVFAIVTAVLAGLAYRAQYRQLKDQLQESKRQSAERRSAQAVMVYMWETRSRTTRLNGEVQGTVYAFARNTSDQPVYDLRFRWHNGDRSLDEELLGEPLRPGDT